jgi:hypothetical protein
VRGENVCKELLTDDFYIRFSECFDKPATKYNFVE